MTATEATFQRQTSIHANPLSDRCKQRNTEQSQNSRRTMKKELVHPHTDTFEGHAQQTESSVEYWLA
jgi:hypothetical protein